MTQETVVYRKPLIVLFTDLCEPAAFSIVILAAAILFRPMRLLVLLGLLWGVGWGLWRYWDWANDWLEITSGFVHNSYQVPLRKRRDIRADLAAVLAVEANQYGTLYTILNLGWVTIGTASDKLTISFGPIRRPFAVQRQIEERREQRVRALRDDEIEKIRQAFRDAIEGR